MSGYFTLVAISLLYHATYLMQMQSAYNEGVEKLKTIFHAPF